MIANKPTDQMDQYVHWLQSLADRLRAGETWREAVATVQHPGSRETAVQRDLASQPNISAGLLARVPSPAIRKRLQVLADAEALGVPILPIVTTLADSLAADLAADHDLAAETAGTRLASVVFLLLPVLGFFLARLVGANPLVWLLSNPVGWALGVGGLVLTLLGYRAVRNLTVAAEALT